VTGGLACARCAAREGRRLLPETARTQYTRDLRRPRFAIVGAQFAFGWPVAIVTRGP